MGPVYDTTFFVILINTRKDHYVAHSQRLHTWCNIDIVSHQQRLPGRKPQDEALMLAAFRVIAQNALNNTSAGDKYVVLLGFEQPSQLFIRGAKSINSYGCPTRYSCACSILPLSRRRTAP